MEASETLILTHYHQDLRFYLSFKKELPEGNADPSIKAGFLYFSPNFSTQMNVSLPFEGHNVAYQCKCLNQSNIVCEYEVNLSTNEKVITEKQNF